MSGIEPFQFEPTYQPREEPPQEENVEQEATCALMPVANECYCCQELEELNQKFINSGLYLLCDYSHEYFV